MFDYVRCEYPLPMPEFQDRVFQTKSFDCPGMDHYLIGTDGSLSIERYEYEDRSKAALWKAANPDKELPEELQGPSAMFCGSFTKVNRRWERMARYTGELNFYTCVGKDDVGWIEFAAHFLLGELKLLEVACFKPAPEQEAPV